MEKNWKTAPWAVRLLTICWVLPLVITLLAVIFLAFQISNPIRIWRIPFDMFRIKYDAMPVSTSIDLGLSIMYFSAVFYAWKLLRGSATSRSVLEMFLWIYIVFTSANLLFPGLRYLEMENISPTISNTPASFLALGASVLGLELAALYLLRTARVRNYTSVF